MILLLDDTGKQHSTSCFYLAEGLDAKFRDLVTVSDQPAEYFEVNDDICLKVALKAYTDVFIHLGFAEVVLLR